MTTADDPQITPDTDELRDAALALGFDAVGFTRPADIGAAGDQLIEFINRGWHGDMGWLADRAEIRRAPELLWAEAETAIVVGTNYGPEADPRVRSDRPDLANISIYAHGRDYHRVLKKGLRALGRWIGDRYAADCRVYVDTAPLLEKPLAQAAGLGWSGKHTNLVSRDFGSWLFLGVLLTTLKLAPNSAEIDHCGHCRACLDVCPTNAFPAPYQLDARRCISYLTIEHRGHIPREFRQAMGNRIYGCDDCLAVCPWNKFARTTSNAELEPRSDLSSAMLMDLVSLDDEQFRGRFSGTAIKRTGRDRFVRNVLIALGNRGDRDAVATIEKHLADPSPLVRAMAVWALGQMLDRSEMARLRTAVGGNEPDPDVLAEWDFVV